MLMIYSQADIMEVRARDRVRFRVKVKVRFKTMDPLYVQRNWPVVQKT